MNTQGTEWTEPGQGATAERLSKAVLKIEYADPSLEAEETDEPLQHLREIGLEPSGPHGDSLRWNKLSTNLRLTGSPLTADDLARIGQCEVA